MPLAVVSFAANQSEFKSTIEEVELAGRLSSESFVKPDGKKGREVILTLRDPVSIDGDEFSGPKTGVIKVQLVFSNNRIRGKTTRLLNRNVRIIGILFHAHKPEHRAPVLMDVKKVAAARA
ncbi:DUF4431 domain-containing protein [bacterium]|nr:MAG: DUF4431 domain-containing protein [bacterium]